MGGAARVLTVDVYLQGLAALVTGLFALVLLAGAPRRSANRFLAFFLLLVAANQAAEAYQGWLRPEPPLLAYQQASAAAAVFAALDPFFLYAFASAYPRRNRLDAAWKLALVGAGSGLLVLTRVLVHRATMADVAAGLPERLSLLGVPVSYLWQLTLYAFTAVTYAVVLLHVSRQFARSPSNPALHLLFPAASIAALPALVRPVHGASGYVRFLAEKHGIEVVPATGALLGGLVGLAVAATVLVLPRWGTIPPEARRTVRWGSVAGLAFAAVFALHPAMVSAGALGALETTAQRLVVGVAVLFVPLITAGRWVLFGLLVSMAVVRHRMLDMSLAARRHAARALVAAIFLGAGTLAVGAERALLGPSIEFLTAGDLLVLGVALAASPWFRAGVERVATRVYGVPLAGDLPGRLEAYRAAVEQAQEEGRSVGADDALARLRRELGLDAQTARVVERMVSSPAGGPLVPGRVVAGRYQVARLLGRGGGGRVFLARDELLERDVVLKEVPHEDGAGAGTALREARAAGALPHANIVAVHDVVRTRAASLIVTEHVPHGSLADLVQREGPLDAERGLMVLDGVLAALEAVHARGIVHRDVKPANVLLGEGDVAKLADFGLARVRQGATVRVDGDGAATDGGGTPAFMAPEQWRGEIATPATDLYAVGRLARRCVRAPLPPAMERAVARALAEDPAERWASAREMREALRRAG